MKKWLLALIALVLLTIAGIYTFIPRQLKISKVTVIPSPANSVYRFMGSPNWKKWLLDSVFTKNSYKHNGFAVEVSPRLFNHVLVTIQHKDSAIQSSVTILTLSPDSAAVQWECSLDGGTNPVQRVLRYNEAKRIKNFMADVLQEVQRYMLNKANVYGAPISVTSTKDTLLVATKAITIGYPSTTDIYDVVAKLKAFIIKKGAMMVGPPLLNIFKMDSTRFQMMVALPADRKLQEEGDIEFKRMVPGNFLLMEVKGGDYTTREAITQIQLYLSDHEKTSMAIPFEVLVTDRMTEPDTSKWITRIYQPVYK
jgi:hypothetical protein